MALNIIGTFYNVAKAMIASTAIFLPQMRYVIAWKLETKLNPCNNLNDKKWWLMLASCNQSMYIEDFKAPSLSTRKKLQRTFLNVRYMGEIKSINSSKVARNFHIYFLYLQMCLLALVYKILSMAEYPCEEIRIRWNEQKKLVFGTSELCLER